MDKLCQVVGKPRAVAILGPESSQWSMFIDDRAESILKVCPSIINQGDGIDSNPIHSRSIMKKGLQIKIPQRALGYNNWRAPD